MARIRTLKPEFFTSEDIVKLSAFARLLFQATWLEADREGRLEWKPKTLRIRYFPLDDVNITDLCQELTDAGLIVLYGDGLAVIPTFTKHQRVNPRESASQLPAPEPCQSRVDESNLDLHVQVGREGKGREGKGKERNDLAPNGACLAAPDDERQSVGLQGKKSYQVPDCRYAELIETYHVALPMLPRFEVLSDLRKGYIRSRWREVCSEFKLTQKEALHWFRGYFDQVAESEFLTGRSPTNKDRNPFVADLEWLTKPNNFAKVIEGRYDNHSRQFNA